MMLKRCRASLSPDFFPVGGTGVSKVEKMLHGVSWGILHNHEEDLVCEVPVDISVNIDVPLSPGLFSVSLCY
jgi:hypothetical protein